MWYKNIAGRFFGLVTKHVCDRRADGRTDRITTPKTALSIARAVKTGLRHNHCCTKRAQARTQAAPDRSKVKPLCRRSIHDDVDPEKLHRVEWIRQLHHRRQRDERQSRDAPANQHITASRRYTKHRPQTWRSGHYIMLRYVTIHYITFIVA